MIALDDIPGWLIAYAAWAIMLMLAVSILLLEMSHAATLSISGSATGNGTAWHIEGAM